MRSRLRGVLVEDPNQHHCGVSKACFRCCHVLLVRFAADVWHLSLIAAERVKGCQMALDSRGGLYVFKSLQQIAVLGFSLGCSDPIFDGLAYSGSEGIRRELIARQRYLAAQ